MDDEELIEAARRNRWVNHPAGAEAEYEARCARWESLSDEDIWGGPRPPLPPIPVKASP